MLYFSICYSGADLVDYISTENSVEIRKFKKEGISGNRNIDSCFVIIGFLGTF
jgi:hypothetical protein